MINPVLAPVDPYRQSDKRSDAEGGDDYEDYEACWGHRGLACLGMEGWSWQSQLKLKFDCGGRFDSRSVVLV